MSVIIKEKFQFSFMGYRQKKGGRINGQTRSGSNRTAAQKRGDSRRKKK